MALEQFTESIIVCTHSSERLHCGCIRLKRPFAAAMVKRLSFWCQRSPLSEFSIRVIISFLILCICNNFFEYGY
jgi:hypothetical protein